VKLISYRIRVVLRSSSLACLSGLIRKLLWCSNVATLCVWADGRAAKTCMELQKHWQMSKDRMNNEWCQISINVAINHSTTRNKAIWHPRNLKRRENCETEEVTETHHKSAQWRGWGGLRGVTRVGIRQGRPTSTVLTTIRGPANDRCFQCSKFARSACAIPAVSASDGVVAAVAGGHRPLRDCDI
jgi:hypothetical protein